MFLIARPRADVITALEAADAFGMVGPESAEGWCAAELPYDQTIGVATEGATWIDIAIDGPRNWIVAVAAGDRPDIFRIRAGALPEGLASALATAVGRPDLATDTEQALTRFLAGQQDETGAPDLVEALSVVLPLPAPGSRPGTGTTVVLQRGGPADLRSMAAVLGPIRMVPTGTEWIAFVPQKGGTDPYGVVAGLSAPKKHLVALLLDRDADHEGFHLWRGGKPVASWNWSRDWADIAPAEARLASERDVAAALARLTPDLDPLALKTLLRSDASAGGQVERLLALLGLPASAMEIASAPTAFEGQELIEKRSVGQVVRDEMANEWAGRREGKSRLRRWDVGFSVAVAVVFGVLVVVGVVRGSVFPPFVASFLLALLIAVVRVRGLLRSERQPTEGASD